MQIDFGIGVSQAIKAHVKDLEVSINKYILNNQEMYNNIRQTVVAQVLNNSNWNPEARYSNSSPLNPGQKYDLTLSGQLLETIASDINNPAGEIEGDMHWVKIGNIAVLDSLKSRREEFGSSGGSEASKNAPYWRFVVFGHRAPRRNFTFVYNTQGPGGAIRPGTPKMRGTPPTYMFSNGFISSIDTINTILDQATSEAIKDMDSRWQSGGSPGAQLRAIGKGRAVV